MCGSLANMVAAAGLNTKNSHALRYTRNVLVTMLNKAFRFGLVMATEPYACFR